MRDDLDGTPQELPVPLLIQDSGINFAGGDGGVDGQVFIHETLIVAQIQIGFRTIVGHEYFAMLDGVHRARVHIQIGIQLLQGNPQPPLFQQAAEGCSGDAFAQAGNHASGDKDVFD